MNDEKPAWARQPLTFGTLMPMLEKGEISSAVYVRRHDLLRMAELARTSKGHTPLSRYRLKKFRAVIDEMEGNDEVEVEGQALCEIVLLAMEALP
jgi:hypothetical protein